MLDTSFLKTSIFSLANVDAEKIFSSIAEDEKEGSQEAGRKRRKLDDFTPQERMIRRKLKNRVAAQSARDRKRERMNELEQIVGRLENENKELKKSNEELKSSMQYLIEQNKELRIRIGMDIDNNSDHTYTQSNGVSDNLFVIKKEEVPSQHAAEIESTPCFLNHDVDCKSKTDQLLDLLERIEPREIFEINASKKTGSEFATEVTKNIQIGGSSSSDESQTDISNLSDEDTNELFDLCQDIQNLVNEPFNTIKTENIFQNSTCLFHTSHERDLTQSFTQNNMKKAEKSRLSDSSYLNDLEDLLNSVDDFHGVKKLMDKEYINSTDNFSLDQIFTELFPSLL